MAQLSTGGFGPRQYPLHPSGRSRFGPLPSKFSGMGRSPITRTEAFVEVIGANVLFEHFLAAAQIMDDTGIEIMNVVGDLGVEEARNHVPYDTGATHDSIGIIGGSAQMMGMGFGFRGSGSQFFVEIGPETFYAPFLEYGTAIMEPRPFMIPAADMMELALVGTVVAIVNAVTGESHNLTGNAAASQVLSDPRVSNPYSGLRTFLYSSAKALGDVSVLGGRGLFGPLRASMYGMARGLGDVGSVMNRTLGTRVSNRLRGRLTGRIIGFGSSSLSFGRTYSAFPGGEGGHRVYQRFVGSHTKSFGMSASGAGTLVNRLMG